MALIDAELKRRDATLALVNWLLVNDAENTDTSLSDPVIEYGVRDRLQQLVDLFDGTAGPALVDTGLTDLATQTTLADVLSTLQSTLSVAVSGLVDVTGSTVSVDLIEPPDTTTFGEASTAAHFHEVTAKFFNPVADEPVEQTTTGDGAVTQPVAGQAKVAASTGTVDLHTVDHVPYRSGHETRGLFTAVFDGASQAGVTRKIGLFNDAGDSGFWFGDVDGVLTVGRIYDGTETTVAVTAPTLTDENGNTVAFDFTKPQIYRMRFGWLGYDGLTIEVHDANEDGYPWVPLYTFNFINQASTDPSLSDPDVGIHFIVENTSGVEAALLTNSWTLGPMLGFLGGIQPDRDIVYPRADGLARDVDNTSVQTTATLGAGGVYESGWVDSDGWGTLEVTVGADVVSATDGIEIEFTDDANAPSPTVRRTEQATFSAADVAIGAMTFRLRSELDGFRIRYINGGTGQSTFFLSVTLRVAPTEPTRSLVATLDETSQAVITRATLAAPDASDVWANVQRGTNGGLDVGVVQHEVETPIKALQSWSTNQSNVGAASAVQIVGSPIANRKTVLVKNLSTSSKVVYIGTSSAVTASSGYELAAGEAVALDLDPTGTGIWAISASGTQRVCWLQIAGT